MRVIITFTTVLAFISLLIKNWVYVYWSDFKNSKQVYVKFMELQNYNLNDQERAIADAEGHSEVKFKRIKFKKESYVSKWLLHLFSIEFLVEVLILTPHPLPYFEQEYTFKIIDMFATKSQLVDVHYMLGDFLFALMFLRFYFLIRTIMNFSVYSDMSSKKICKNNGFENNTAFCFKAMFQKNMGQTILMVSVISIMWLSYLLRIFEK